jgi:hypothetical protein
MRQLLACVTAAVIALAFSVRVADAQYPNVSGDIASRSNAKKAAADKRSDEIFAKGMDQIKKDADAGKRYIPGAAMPEDLPQADIPAFPGAWGGGMYSFGGRGGKVMVVSSLADSGPGTFREACEAAGPRIVVFNVAGIIKLDDRIRIRAPYITIAGNTAPGDGICIAGNTVELESHDMVIRHMRFRRGATDVGDRNDAIGGNPVGNVMIDHVSASWGLDENMSMYRHMYSPPGGGKDLKLPTVNITIQNSIFSEGLNTYAHAFGSTIGGLNSTFHHNLWACNTGRNPSVGMGGDFTFVNNVLFNWRHRTVDGGDNTSRYNIINNYLKPGPATPKGEIAYRLLKPETARGKNAPLEYGKAYVNGNITEGNDAVTNDNWAGGVQTDGEHDEKMLLAARVNEPFKHASLPVQPAREAYDTVLANAGATLPKRDAVDVRVIEMVRSGKVSTKKAATIAEDLSKVGFTRERVGELIDLVDKGIITDISQVGGHPEYKGDPYADADSDGMPDAWEKKNGLNSNDASDAAKDASGDGYTNIEKYIHRIDPASKTDWKDLKNNHDPATPITTASN